MIRGLFIVVVMWVALAVSPVSAELPKPPGPPPAKSPYAAYGIAFLLVVAVCAGAFKNSQRSHLD